MTELRKAQIRDVNRFGLFVATIRSSINILDNRCSITMHTRLGTRLILCGTSMGTRLILAWYWYHPMKFMIVVNIYLVLLPLPCP
jgi:hypothetical protein